MTDAKPDFQAQAELIQVHIERSRALVDTLASEEAYNRNQPGSVSRVRWSRDLERQAIVRALDGEPLPEFDPTDMNRIFAAGRRVGLSPQHPSAHSPFRAGLKDKTKPANGGREVWALFFSATGSLIGAHSGDVHVRPGPDSGDPVAMLVILLTKGNRNV